MIIAMALAYGGTAQIIAGIIEYRNGNTFATLSFGSFGFFLVLLCHIANIT
jgi:succinate-acetate transporter protein